MTGRSGLFAKLRGRRTESAPAADDARGLSSGAIDPGALQVFAHTLIADLFGAGLRLQNLGARLPDDSRAELEQIADQIDKTIHDIRAFTFTHRKST